MGGIPATVTSLPARTGIGHLIDGLKRDWTLRVPGEAIRLIGTVLQSAGPDCPTHSGMSPQFVALYLHGSRRRQCDGHRSNLPGQSGNLHRCGFDHHPIHEGDPEESLAGTDGQPQHAPGLRCGLVKHLLERTSRLGSLRHKPAKLVIGIDVKVDERPLARRRRTTRSGVPWRGATDGNHRYQTHPPSGPLAQSSHPVGIMKQGNVFCQRRHSQKKSFHRAGWTTVVRATAIVFTCVKITVSTVGQPRRLSSTPESGVTLCRPPRTSSICAAS